MAKNSTTISFSAPKIIEDILRADAIRKGQTLSFVINSIIEGYYTQNDIMNKKLNFLLQNSKNADKVPSEWLEEKSIFDLKVSVDEITASKYPSKKRYVRKHFTHQKAETFTDLPKNILDIDKFLK